MEGMKGFLDILILGVFEMLENQYLWINNETQYVYYTVR